MNPLIERHREAIRTLCREYGVTRRVAPDLVSGVGSAATDDFDPDRSDIDFIVAYPPDADLGLWLSHHFAFRDELETLLGRPVDLVMAGAIRKPRFIQAVNETRQVLYAA